MILLTEVDAIGGVFGVAHMDFIHWVVLTLIAMVPLAIHELIVLIKWYLRKTKASKFYKIFTLSFIAFIIAVVLLAIILVCVL